MDSEHVGTRGVAHTQAVGEGGLIQRRAEWRPMTDMERKCALALSPGRVTYPVASYPKRLARSLHGQAEADEPQITNKQAETMWRQAWRFRRQVADADVRAEAARRHEMEVPKP